MPSENRMVDKNVTATPVEAQDICVKTQAHLMRGMGAVAMQPSFAPVRRRDLMAAVNTLARDLGLRAASVIVLDALLSCLPCRDKATGQDGPITPLTLLTVFAANDTLCFRAKGITERQLRRHLEKLEGLGLVQRRDSANGKRFAIHQKGKVVGAFGIDLSPLLAQSEDLLVRAAENRQRNEELRGLKSIINHLRGECLGLDLTEELRGYVESTRNLMRRTGVTLVQARAIISRLQGIISELAAAPLPHCPPEINDLEIDDLEACKQSKSIQVDAISSAPQANQKPATDGQNVRHKKTEDPNTKKRSPSISIWSSLTSIPEFFPDQPRSEEECHRLLYDFGRMMGLSHSSLITACGRLGLLRMLEALDAMARDIARIANPDAYLRKLVDRHETGKVGHGQLSQNRRQVHAS